MRLQYTPKELDTFYKSINELYNNIEYNDVYFCYEDGLSIYRLTRKEQKLLNFVLDELTD